MSSADNPSMPKRYALAALDMDGTVLNSQHEFSEKTSSIIQRLSHAGLQIAIATGRSAYSVQEKVSCLSLNQDVPFVCHNGAVGGIIPKTGEPPVQYFSSALSTEKIDLILDLGKSLDCVVQYYNGTTGDVYAVPTNNEHIELLKKYADLTGRDQIILSSYENAKQICFPSKMLIMSNNVDHIIQIANNTLPLNYFHIIKGSPNPFFVEFLSYGVTKGDGLIKLCNILHISIDQVVAYGDGDNDREMLEYAGYGVAVYNAKDITKQTANHVLNLTNNEDGVALHLEQLEIQHQLIFK